MKTLAERLIWARTNRGVSQEMLAKEAGVSQSTIGNLEAGLRNSARKIVVIAHALDVDARWLAEGIGKPAGEDTHSFSELNGLEAQLVMLYRGLSGSGKDDLLRAANNLATKGSVKPSVKDPFPAKRVADAIERHTEIDSKTKRHHKSKA